MKTNNALTSILAALFLASALGCNMMSGSDAEPTGNAPLNKATTDSQPKPAEDGTIPSGTGTEKAKPAAGKGNVQGKVFFNEKPASGIEVKLCETFSRFGSGCGGATFTAKTDDNGEYLITDVPPGTYEGLTVKVFDTPYYVFATSGFVSAAKYPIEADKTYFAPDTHLFKSDLKITNPKAGGRVAGEGLEIKWEPYTDAAYYKVSIHADDSNNAAATMDYIAKKVEDTSFVLDKALPAGKYRVKIDAFNQNDRKIAQAADDQEFTVTN